ncbi:type VI secretion system contractile sheath large subunit [Fangia hongkongensis]|uniref:type VI secretion system contractile sheath large subunit n=2 Tax=Fangia hongkongensis TaxID=270495 RepID=UPI000373032D|nr:type VI secretion system contractile sheath large subunit [Fangia hongkongensis]
MSKTVEALLGTANVSQNQGLLNQTLDHTGFNQIALVKKEDSEKQDTQEFLIALNTILADLQNGENFSKEITSRIKAKIDQIVDAQLNEVLKNKDFRYFESMWLSLNDVFMEAEDAEDVEVCLYEVTKQDLIDDFELNSADYTGSNLFKNIYSSEYDQFGGEPYSLVVGMFDIQRNYDDFFMLSNIGKVCASAHAPFLSNVGAEFFGYESFDAFSEVNDVAGLLDSSKYSLWKRFRKTEEAAYVGLTFPRYLLRRPYESDSPELFGNRGRNQYSVSFFSEKQDDPFDQNSYQWGYASGLMARNIIKSFKKTGWTQYIRGPLGGGLIDDLPTYEFDLAGYTQKTGSVEYFISDSQEYAFARSGFMPFVGDKRAQGGCFFSVQSAKYIPEHLDDLDMLETIQANANLSYTLSVSRVAHYLKSMVRDRIGSTYDIESVNGFISDWLNSYVTIASNPTDVTLAYYPFKQASARVESQPGKLGWYSCNIDLVPHIQLEGIDVSLRLATKLPIEGEVVEEVAEDDGSSEESESAEDTATEE